jgi:hypothetical protein
MFGYVHQTGSRIRPLAEPVKEATVVTTNGGGAATNKRITVRTATREDGVTTLLAREDAIQAATGSRTGQLILRFDGVDYALHRHDQLTHDYIFWPATKTTKALCGRA